MGVWQAFRLGVLVAAAAAAVASPAEAFITSFGGGGSKMLRAGQRHQPSFRSSGSCSRQRRADLGMKYVPDGLSPEQWKKMQKEEAEKKKKMGDLGQVGVKSFKSRSLQAWQEDGAGHLFPVDPKKVKSGEIPPEKTPYMQRKGAWDNSDLTKKNLQKKWSATDKAYATKPTTAAEKKAAAAKKAADDKKKAQKAQKLNPDDVGKKKGMFGLW
ncbi:unnamed protein product [Ectocarpus sp. 6 AP-2014]